MTDGEFESVHVRLPPDLLREIEQFRRTEHDLPTRAEAIRRLIERAVKAHLDKK